MTETRVWLAIAPGLEEGKGRAEHGVERGACDRVEHADDANAPCEHRHAQPVIRPEPRRAEDVHGLRR